MLFNSKNRTLLGVLLLIMTLVWTAFIFLNSASEGEQSAEQSDKVVEMVERAAEKVGISFEDRDTLHRGIRKSAHFLEFALLGALCFMTAVAFELKPYAFSAFPIGYCVIAAATDEYIQTFTPGRVGQISDVMIDVAGASFAILICLAVLLLIDLRKKHTRKKAMLRTETESAD